MTFQVFSLNWDCYSICPWPFSSTRWLRTSPPLLYWTVLQPSTLCHIQFSSANSNTASALAAVLMWFASHLTDHTQCVAISGVKSTAEPLPCGVSQGSVLGPILFTIDSIQAHHTSFHLYAGDSHLYNAPHLLPRLLSILWQCLYSTIVIVPSPASKTVTFLNDNWCCLPYLQNKKVWPHHPSPKRDAWAPSSPTHPVHSLDYHLQGHS